MPQHLGKHIKRLLMAQGFKPGSFEGCSKEELNRAMQAQKVTFLPRKYIEFMEIMGKKGLPFVSRAYYCNGLIDFKQALLEQVAFLEFSYRLPEDGFVFWEHHEVSFLFFRINNQDDDPPVYLYKMGFPEAEIKYPSISDYYMESCSNILDQYR